MSESNGGKVAAAGGAMTIMLLARLCVGHVDDIARVGSHGLDDVGRAAATVGDDIGRAAAHVDSDVPRVLKGLGKSASADPTDGVLRGFGHGAEEVADNRAAQISTVVNDSTEVQHLRAEERIATWKLPMRPLVADPRVERPRLVHALPGNESEFEFVYGRSPTAADHVRMAQHRSRYGAQGGRPTRSVDTLLAEVAGQGDAGPVVIVAHSEQEGALLVLPDGQRLPVTELHESCTAAGTRCVVLTCYGSDLQLAGQIAPEEALKMWVTALAYSRNYDTSLQEFTRVMRFDLRTRRAARGIAVSSVLVGSGGAVVSLNRREE